MKLLPLRQNETGSSVSTSGCRIAVIIPVFQTGDRSSTLRTRTIFMTKHLIIIPGIGDDHPVYHKGAWIFRLWGFKTQVHVFGWDSADAASYEQRINGLSTLVHDLDGEVYLLGVSAGGSAAVNSFAMLPEKVTRAATLCSPLAAFSSRINPLLAASIARTEDHLANMPHTQKQRLLSVHAFFDPVVPIRLSKPAGIKNVTLPVILHPVTIYLGLTVFSGLIAGFFKQR